VKTSEPRLPASPVVPHLTPAERAARGRAARHAIPRDAHASWEPPAGRRNPVELLEEQAQTRLPELVPIRYGRMLASPFAFYRGAAFIMASDLAGLPRTGLTAQLCGDAHLSNFGGFDAPDRRLVFSITDFDETLPGPFEWDVKRLTASFAAVARVRGFDGKVREKINLRVARTYRESMATFAAMRNLDVWYARLDADEMIAQFARKARGKDIRQVEKAVEKARTKDSLKAMAKFTEVVDGQLRIASDPPIIVPVEDIVPADQLPDLHEFARGIVRSYRRTLSGDRRRLLERFRYVHAARKVVGVGSVGTRDWIMLLLGRDDDDPLFLQIKEAQASVLEPFLGASSFASSGQRVVEGQRLTQAASDIMLGWIRATGLDGVSRDFYVRQLWDAKASPLVETMDPFRLEMYARICGWTLALAHARSGDAIAIASYLGSGDAFDRALASFAEAYAEQNQADYEELRKAAADGRVTAEAP
jgi:uncharacterized protein (DUF2252 family)